jgi:ribulose-5-phosphate 4-epimerase/fuculose-1-phosphate aldolase
MKGFIDKYLHKLSSQGLCGYDGAIFIALDDVPYSNRPINSSLLKVFELIHINTLLIARPSEPYLSSIIGVLRANDDVDKIIPADCETRTFFHDIPVIDNDSPENIAKALSNRKAALFRDGRIVSCGTVSPEQAYIAFSSVCFSLFVKYLFDGLKGSVGDIKPVLEGIIRLLPQKVYLTQTYDTELPLKHTPRDHNEAIRQIVSVGKAMVDLRLVDSYFGNISCLVNDSIYITQTGSSMDEIAQAIDIIPLRGGSTTGITASSEFSAHRAIYERTDLRFILHGHPKFAVIMSMHCHYTSCRGDNCYRACDKERHIGESPIVSGEIGTGTYGLLNTVPKAMLNKGRAIVYGHGVFVGSREGFQEALRDMIEIERYCFKQYMDLIRAP